MNDNDFRTACDVLVVRWRFDQIVEREFEQTASSWVGSTPGEVRRLATSGDLLDPTDDGTPTVQSGPVNNGDS